MYTPTNPEKPRQNGKFALANCNDYRHEQRIKKQIAVLKKRYEEYQAGKVSLITLLLNAEAVYLNTKLIAQRQSHELIITINSFHLLEAADDKYQVAIFDETDNTVYLEKRRYNY